MVHGYDVGTRAWQPDQKEGWVPSEVSSKKVSGDKVVLVFALENGEVGCSFNYGHAVDTECSTHADKEARDHRRRAAVRWNQSSSADEPYNARSK